MAKTKLKPKETWWRKALNYSGYALILAAVLFVISFHTNQNKNQLFSLFGYSIAVIQSGSMVAGGYDIGERVLIRSCNSDNLRVGDIIVFYMYTSTGTSTNLTDITDTPDIQTDGDESSSVVQARKPLADIRNEGKELIFHRINRIMVDDYGFRFFETLGDSNNGRVDGFIYEKYVVGQNIALSETVSSVLNFATGTMGMFIIILFPIAILGLLQVKAFTAQMFGAMLANKLIQRKIHYNDKDLKDVDISDYLSDYEKYYVYDVTPQKEKEEIVNLIWGDLDDKEMDIKQKVSATYLKKSFTLYKQDRDKFWDYWIEKEKSNFSHRKLQIYKIRADLVLKQGMSDEEAEIKAVKIFKETNSNGNGN